MRASVLTAVGASLLLGGVMTAGDAAWEFFSIRHTATAGVLHGAAMCLCLGLVIGLRTGRPAPGIVAGPAVGALAAGAFYALAPSLGWLAMLPAWMLFWICFGILQAWLTRDRLSSGLARGVVAATASALAFFAVSGMWTAGRHPTGFGDYAARWLLWSFAFLPGFVALFAIQPRPGESPRTAVRTRA